MEKADYGINVRSRFRPEKSHEELYAAAAARLAKIPPPWGFQGLKIKPLPPIKKNISTGVSYTRELGAPIRTFGMGFINRAPPLSARRYESDDALTLDFNIDHRSVDYGYLMREVLPTYVEAMDAYFLRVDDHRISTEDAWEQVDERTHRPNPEFVDFRDGVNRIWPANYWDRELCRLAFALTPDQVVHRLTGHVAEARILRDGALVTYSYDRVPDDQIASIDGQLRPLLLSKPKLAWSR